MSRKVQERPVRPEDLIGYHHVYHPNIVNASVLGTYCFDANKRYIYQKTHTPRPHLGVSQCPTCGSEIQEQPTWQ